MNKTIFNFTPFEHVQIDSYFFVHIYMFIYFRNKTVPFCFLNKHSNEQRFLVGEEKQWKNKHWTRILYIYISYNFAKYIFSLHKISQYLFLQLTRSRCREKEQRERLQISQILISSEDDMVTTDMTEKYVQDLIIRDMHVELLNSSQLTQTGFSLNTFQS